MTTSIAGTRPRPPIRLPFRVLAGVIAILSIVSLSVRVWMSLRGAHALTAGDIEMLPLAAWFTRLMVHAIVNGRAPQGDLYWPLASGTVWQCYWILLIVQTLA